MGNGINGIFPPVPPLPGEDMLKTIAKIVKAAWDILTDEPPREISKTAPVSEGTSPDDIQQITSFFTELGEQARVKSAKIESCVKTEVQGCLDGIRQLFEGEQDVAAKYGIRLDRAEQKMRMALSRMDGVVDREIARMVSLNNPACRRVMEMLPGLKKEQALQAFWDQAVQEAVGVYCAGIREMLAEVFEQIEEETAGAVAAVEKSAAASYAQIQDVDAGNYQEETEKIIGCACRLLGVHAAVCEIFGEDGDGAF